MRASTVEPELLLLAAMLRLAIRDAQRHSNSQVRADAQRWLWSTMPTIAERAAVPREFTEQCEGYDSYQ